MHAGALLAHVPCFTIHVWWDYSNDYEKDNAFEMEFLCNLVLFLGKWTWPSFSNVILLTWIVSTTSWQYISCMMDGTWISFFCASCYFSIFKILLKKKNPVCHHPLFSFSIFLSFFTLIFWFDHLVRFPSIWAELTSLNNRYLKIYIFLKIWAHTFPH